MVIKQKKPPGWTLSYERFDPAKESLREAICALGNGYLGTRGVSPEAVADKIHYPGTYVAGLYNHLGTHISGKTIVNEDMVNCPNWLFLTFRIGDDEWFCPSSNKLLQYHQELDMRRGVLKRTLRFINKKRQKTTVYTERIVSMADPHVGAIKYVITPENYNDWITVRTMLDGAVQNTGVARYRQLNSQHLVPNALDSFSRNGIFLSMKTNRSAIEIALASKIRLFCDSRELRPVIKTVTRRLLEGERRIGQEFRFFAYEKRLYEIEKIVSLYTSRDRNVSSPATQAIQSLQTVKRYDEYRALHEREWNALWVKFDIQIDGDQFAQKVVRLHTFHLLQTASVHNVSIDAGLPARGLNGEAYRGHIFWDEIYAMPFYEFRMPEISQALLLYRYRRLFAARDYARKNGFKGAMFPWQSGSTGKEETQIIHLNPMSGKWGPDYSRLQRHVSFAIAYNVWQCYKRSGDVNFMIRYGAELLCSIAQFCATLAYYNERDGRFHTKGMMGPDEFHEKNPHAEKPGVEDNAYSNVMIVWTLLKAKEVLAQLPEEHRRRLVKRLRLEDKDFLLWEEITKKMNVLIDQNGIIEQFKGYFALKELDWAGYRAEYGNIRRMDRILKAEGKSPDDYKVAKQADVLMLFYLLPFSEVQQLFARLGYGLDKNTIKKNYEYYIKRTSHGSSLSKVVHCFVAQQLGKLKEAQRLLVAALESDIYDSQGGTTPEGIHVGVMGGTIDIIIRSFMGVSIEEGKLHINPFLPKQWKKIKLRFFYRDKWVSLTLGNGQLNILVHQPLVPSGTVDIEVVGKTHTIALGKAVRIPLKKRTFLR